MPCIPQTTRVAWLADTALDSLSRSTESLHSTLTVSLDTHSPLHHRPLTLCQRAVRNRRTGSGEAEPVLEPPERCIEAGERGMEAGESCIPVEAGEPSIPRVTCS